MKKFDIYLVDFEPTTGSEINKIRPGLIISPNQMNEKINTVIILPMITKIKNWSSRMNIAFNEKNGQVAFDQIRAIDKKRLLKKLGQIDDDKIQAKITGILSEMFEL